MGTKVHLKITNREMGRIIEIRKFLYFLLGVNFKSLAKST